MNLPHHGSNPKHVYNSLQLKAPQNILDFSVNTNPYGPPKFIHENWEGYSACIQDYPDPDAAELLKALSVKEKVPESFILAGNGAAELIFLLGQMLKGQDVLIIEPSFSEYRQALEVQGASIDSLVLLEENNWDLDSRIFTMMEGKKAVFLCSPNNPTGKVYSRSILLDVIEQAEKAGTLVICDEAFYDFAENEPSVVSELHRYPNLIILRSVTKMYALAGLRLGYILAEPSIIGDLKKRQPHWSVNALAQVIGRVCAADAEHAQKTRLLIELERKRVMRELSLIGIRVYPSSTNFYLIAAPKEEGLFRFLLEKGITVRHTENFAGLNGNYLRIAVKLPEENDQLIQALKEWKYC
ncbi:threonine-phosphate decarboxylase [Bacillus sp. FJAT-42376]|uniref:threonine-phosphate decarboxylase CobD n=1 Tax=Bacillus sp. FJAT-42376 TaxID=2014076 RepID=UPI000F4FDB8E|nr:threonine-phosphate decarboxylase CobD [Bacillus sp. FJAT-42376]AZB42677.1 threonine-phosphate decarboxylase [Bacillus sp. FJAT-42376]